MVYQVILSDKQPAFVRVRLRLPEPAARADRIDLGGIPHRDVRRERVSDVRCDGSPLEPCEKGGWRVPAGCKLLEWVVEAVVPPPAGVDASKQHALYQPQDGWWVLSGPALLMRSVETSYEATLELELPRGGKLFTLLDKGEDGRFSLPPPHTAPVFMVAGSPRVTEDTVSGVRLRYITDKGAEFDPRAVLQAHGRGIAYLDALVPGKPAVAHQPRALDVTWIGIARASGMIGGAAGHRSLVVNYLTGAGNDLPAFRKLPLMVLFHEQCHSLFYGLPLWMTESLAQYYAFKTMEKTGLLDAASTKFVYERFAVRPEGAPTLLALYRDFMQHNDQRLYMKFYTQGSAFWREVDRAIAKHSEGNKNLDDVLPRLLSLSYDSGGTLPTDFFLILHQAGGDAIDTIVGTHLGR